MWGFVAFHEIDSVGAGLSLTGALTLNAGELVVVGVRSQYGSGDNTPTSLTDTIGNTYTHVSHSIDTFLFGGEVNDLYFCENVLGGTGTITVVFPVSSAYATLLIGRYSGMALSGALDSMGVSSGLGSGQPSMPITTISPDVLVIGFAVTATGPSVTASSLTDRTGTFLTGYGVFGDHEQTPAGSFTATTTSTGSAAWNGLVAGFKIAGGAPPAGARPTICVME